MTKQNLLIILTPYIINDPSDLRRIFERKMRERREFMERYSAFRDDKDYDAEVDYRRKRGLLEEINQTAHEAEEEAIELRNAETMLGRDMSGEVTIEPPPTAPIMTPRRHGGRAAGARADAAAAPTGAAGALR